MPWTVAHQAPLSTGFPRQEYWNGLPFPSRGDLPDPGIEPVSPALAGGFFTTESPGKPSIIIPWCLSSLSYWITQMSLGDKDCYAHFIDYQTEAYPDLLVYKSYTPVLLPGESHGQRSLVGCSPWGRSESDTTERLHFHFSLSCTGEWNGNPLQCSCLENPRDRGAWWAAVYGAAELGTTEVTKQQQGIRIWIGKYTEHNSFGMMYLLLDWPTRTEIKKHTPIQFVVMGILSLLHF